MKLQW